MGTYNASNYTEQGGARTVIGGEIDVITGGEVKIAGVKITKTAEEINALTANPVQDNVTAVSAADAGTQGESYVQADVQAIATLANANKAAINALITACIAAGIIAEAE